MFSRIFMAWNVLLLNSVFQEGFTDAFVLWLTSSHTIDRAFRSTLAEPVTDPVLSSAMCTTVQRPISNAWQHLVPKLLEKPAGFDHRIQWNADEESSREMAERWLLQFSHVLDHHVSPTDCEEMVENLEESAEKFVQFCKRHLSGRTAVKQYKARLVATRGSASTKCPQWHIDHVPVRWVQALYGPGCDWVESSDVHWESINALDDDDGNDSVSARNKKLVEENARIHRAKQGDGMLLIGNRWQDLATVGGDIPAAVHKSADGFLPWQRRVLLTMDPATND